MRRRIVLDTGPLIAYLNRREQHHQWAKEQWRQAVTPLLTCEAVISEACFLLERAKCPVQPLMELLRRGTIHCLFHLAKEVEPVAKLMQRYADVPMSLADACLVRMAEIYDDSAVMTLDGDFRRYRKNGRQVIPLIIPRQRT